MANPNGGRGPKLTPKQAKFVAEYLIDLNATQAAIRAGYHPKMAAKLVAKSSILAAIAAGQARHLEKADLSAQLVLEELRRVAFNDARSFWHADGTLKRLDELTADEGALLAGFDVVIKNAAAGDGHTDTVHKIKFWDKIRALEMLAKHFALLTETVNVAFDTTLLERLRRGRIRNAERG